MLENKIKELSKKMVLAAAVIALNLSCAPGLIVPTQVPTPEGYVTTGKDCCKQLNCHNYNGCKEEGEEYNPQTGIYEMRCSCYGYNPPASPPSYEPKGADPYEPKGGGRW